MASKVMVKIPVTPFGQVNKSKSGNVNGELVSVTRSQQDLSSRNQETPRGSESSRVAQLEQNIRFLQEQHQLMLTGLHKEIESLRNRNRDLQFQLVFSKGSIPSSPSSPEDDTKHKVYISPKQVNVTPLQVELLEKELGELKIQIQESESKNAHLSTVVEEQRLELVQFEQCKDREISDTKSDTDLVRKLEESENLVKKLRRENSDLRRENAAGSSSHYHSRDSTVYHNRENGTYQSRNGQNQPKNNGRHRPGGGHYRGNWFPPLHTQSYWQGGRQGERNTSASAENNTLPSLQQNGTGGSQYQGRRGTNNNHYHNGDGRKYRNGQNKSSKPS